MYEYCCITGEFGSNMVSCLSWWFSVVQDKKGQKGIREREQGPQFPSVSSCAESISAFYCPTWQNTTQKTFPLNIIQSESYNYYGRIYGMGWTHL